MVWPQTPKAGSLAAFLTVVVAVVVVVDVVVVEVVVVGVVGLHLEF